MRTQEQMTRFKACNETLFQRTDLLQALPDSELFAYMSKCFKVPTHPLLLTPFKGMAMY